HRLGIPVIFFVSPQLWAWKQHRIRLVQKYVDKMLVIFPFEEQFYRDNGVNAEFVGHPLADLLQPNETRDHFAAAHYLNPAATWIALLPGSRAKEIRDNLPEMLVAARMLANRTAQNAPAREGAQRPQFIIPLAPTLTAEHRRRVIRLVGAQDPDLTIRVVDDARTALFHARASIVASGTATVEAALIGNPFLVVYRVSPLTYAIAKRVVSVPHVAMANLIAGKRVVPELLQSEFTASNIVQQLEPLLPDGPPRQSMMQELIRIRTLLGTAPGGQGQATGAIDRVAAITLEVLGVPSPVIEPVRP
ncbi:MAG TPA: lipid-A-disaccharide synthase, partial [Candidatus Sulfotelmatobacter sp.]|nr:lipid-A-disaccharide synthase [Candidatus Sulfotelmatobacter sp.]